MRWQAREAARVAALGLERLPVLAYFPLVEKLQAPPPSSFERRTHVTNMLLGSHTWLRSRATQATRSERPPFWGGKPIDMQRVTHARV